MPYPTRNGLNIFTTRQNGIKYTKKNGSFYVRSKNDNKLRFYTKKKKTGAIKNKTLTPSASSSSTRYSTAKSKSKHSSSTRYSTAKSKSKHSSSTRYSTAKSKSKSKSKSTSNSSTLFRKNIQRRRLTRSLRLGKISRKSCGKNRRTNRCRFVRGNERTSKNCHISSRNRCVKFPKFNRTQCGHNKSTNRCQFLRRGRKASNACKLSNGRCTKVSKSR